MANSIDLISSELARRIQEAGDLRQRKITVSLAKAVTEATGLDERAEVRQALQALKDGRYGELPERSLVQRLVDSLDELAFNAQERYEQNVGPESDYAQAFSRARAATAVLEAFEPSAGAAVANVIYEAYYALNENLRNLEVIIESEL